MFKDELLNKRILVVGLGHFGGGTAVARWLVDQGARVLVTDKAPPEKLADSLKELAGLPIEFRLGEHREEDFTNADLIVASPAVPPNSPFLQAGRQAGVPITTEIRLFIERCPARIFGVTGTKGKSTTTAMLGRILQQRFNTHVGGNIGKSLLSDLPEIKPDHLVVLELSSFMLEYLEPTRFAPHVALVTFVAKDHLDRHHTLENYLAAKRNIVRFQSPADFAVVCEENPLSLSFADFTAAQVVRYGVNGRKAIDLPLPGMHNQLNAQGALAAASCVGCNWDDAQRALADFKGLPHRLQLVHMAGGVSWYDDSIATIPEAAVAALRAFPPGRVIQIVGGSYKQIPFDNMATALANGAKAVLTIGATGPAIAELIRQQHGRTMLKECGNLPSAVAEARRLAESGDTVLLSPGCASFDQFANFEARGEMFAALASSEPQP